MHECNFHATEEEEGVRGKGEGEKAGLVERRREKNEEKRAPEQYRQNF